MSYLSRFLTLCLAALLLQAGAAESEIVAKVTGVSDAAVVTRNGSRQAIRRNLGLEVGDVIRTNESGEVQIAFVDRTRMVVGPSSQLEVEDIRLSSATKASKFTVKALGGTYRFLSGGSPKNAYSIKTPTATMGIRGTEFDFSITRRRLTNLVTFSGQVRVCTRFNRCVRVSGGCAVVKLFRGRFEQPETEEDKKALLRQDFPYVVSQQQLANEFRVETGPCGEVGESVTTTTTVAPPTKSALEQRDDPGGFNAEGYSEAEDER